MKTQLQSNPLQSLYAQDFYLWIVATTQALKSREFDQLDLENLIEEIECMGKSLQRELKSRLIRLMEYLLKLNYWELEKEYNSRGWRNTIIEQRTQVLLLLEQSPSLRGVLNEYLLECYRIARKNTSELTQLPIETFPAEPPFSPEDIFGEVI